ncbi:hypothetical protein KEM56_006541 [Ascosphaera pollenicola]|nr:hypothetical protein KEM56_006541 [Ascosphaera pollenicola]
MPTANEIAPSRPQTATNNRTLQCLRKVLDFAVSLQKCLSAAEEQIAALKRNPDGTEKPTPGSTGRVIDSINVSALDDVIASVSSLPSNIASTKHAQTIIPFAENARVEPLATRVWNQCTRVMRMVEDGGAENQEAVYDKICRETGQLDLALRVLEKAAVREERLSSRCIDCTGDSASTLDEQKILRRLSAEYHMLRMTLSWRQKRLDITEHMRTKVPKQCIEQEASIAEAFADICYDIGHAHLEERDFPLAVKWLERAADALSKHDLDKLSPDADELRLAVWHALARAKMASPNADGMDFTTLTDVLSKEYGNRLPVMLLNIEMIGKEAEPDFDLYHEKLIGLLRTVPLTNANLNILDLAADALYQLIFQRLALHNDPVPLEKGFVTYIWMQTSDSSSANALDHLHSSATKLHAMIRRSINAEATYACLILIWKKIDQCFVASDYATAEKWLQLARHSIFENSGETNKSKLTRVALLDDDLNLATTCIEGLCQKGPDATVYLQACVAEAQRMGKKHHAALVLQRLLHDLLESQTFDAAHLPVLLRCTARLLLAEFDTDVSMQREIEDEICNLFDTAMAQAEKYHVSQPDTTPFTVMELEWFSKNSYNLAVQHCSAWAPRNIQRLLTVCINLIGLYPTSLDDNVLEEVRKRRMLCNFLGAIISMAQARAHPDAQMREEHYATSRNYILGFRQYLLDCSNLDEDSLEKHKTILAFDFEAAVRLQQFSDLTEIVDESQQYASEELYGIFIDAMLGSDAPVEVVGAVFQVSLDSNVEVAEGVLDQAYALARDAHHKHLENKTINTCYPSDEIEWLATTGFNKAVDFYLAGDDGACGKWALKALDIANLMHDKGVLYQILKGKMAALEIE